MRVDHRTTPALYLEYLEVKCGAGPMGESAHQMFAFQYFKIREKREPLFEYIHSVPNGGHRSKAAAGKMKGEGQKPGVPDVFWDIARAGMHGLRVELKTPTWRPSPTQKILGATRVQGGALSDDQAKWLDHYRAQGYHAVVAHGCIELIAIVEGYLVGDLSLGSL